jgi:multidrug efflux pump
MLGATVIAVFFIPMFYYVIETLSGKVGKKDRASGGTDPASASVAATPEGGGPVAASPLAPRNEP